MPAPGMTGYLARFIDPQVEGHIDIGFFGPEGLLPTTAPIDQSRIFSWIAQSVLEKADAKVSKMARQDVIMLVEGHPDVVWPSWIPLTKLALPAQSERRAMLLSQSLAPASSGSDCVESIPNPSFRPRF